MNLRPPPKGAYAPPVAGAANPQLAELEKAANGPGKETEIWDGTPFVPSATATRIYETLRPWTGLDVYLDPKEAALGGVGDILSIGVFAVTRGMRTLVASGRTRDRGAAAPVQRLCSARVPIASSFEIYFGCSVIPNTLTSPCRVIVVASNDLTPPNVYDDLDGVIPVGQPAAPGILDFGPMLTIAPDPVIPYTLVGINAIAVIAGVTMHIHNFSTIVPGVANGIPPAFAFGIPVVGSTVFGSDPMFSQLRRRQGNTLGNFTILSSSTVSSTTVTAANAARMQGWIR